MKKLFPIPGAPLNLYRGNFEYIKNKIDDDFKNKSMFATAFMAQERGNLSLERAINRVYTDTNVRFDQPPWSGYFEEMYDMYHLDNIFNDYYSQAEKTLNIAINYWESYVYNGAINLGNAIQRFLEAPGNDNNYISGELSSGILVSPEREIIQQIIDNLRSDDEGVANQAKFNYLNFASTYNLFMEQYAGQISSILAYNVNQTSTKYTNDNINTDFTEQSLPYLLPGLLKELTYASNQVMKINPLDMTVGNQYVIAMVGLQEFLKRVSPYLHVTDVNQQAGQINGAWANLMLFINNSKLPVDPSLDLYETSLHLEDKIDAWKSYRQVIDQFIKN